MAISRRYNVIAKKIYARKHIAHKQKCLTRIGVLYTSIGMLACKNHTLGEAASSLRARKPSIKFRNLESSSSSCSSSVHWGFPLGGRK